MKLKRVAMNSRTDLIELARHLRQEHLFVVAERQHLQNLNEKVLKTVEQLYHLAWIARQQRVNLDNLILSHADSNPSACCSKANLLESVNFLDSYKQLGAHDTAYAEFLQQLREHPKLVATCLVLGERFCPEAVPGMVHTVMSAIYGDCVIPEDEVLVLRLLKDLMVLQPATSDNPRRLLRHGSCAFSRVYKIFNEGLFSAKLFLTAALHDPIMNLLMEDDLFLDIDPGKAVVRFPHNERLRHFGHEGTPEYAVNLQKYRNWIINRLVNLAVKFIAGIRNNVYCFPQSLSWLVRQMYSLVTKAKRVEVKEVGAMCADLVFAFFICPAIVNPEPYGITDAPISYIARFNLMQVAQILQVLAMSKWEEIDPKLMDLYGKFEKDCMSSLLDMILESSAEDSPNDLISQLHELTRSAVLITEPELMGLVCFLVTVQQECEDESLKNSLSILLGNIPSPPPLAPCNNGTQDGTPQSSTPSITPADTPPHTPSTRRNLLGKVNRKGVRSSILMTSQDNCLDDLHPGHQEECTSNPGSARLADVLVIPFSNIDYDCPGMLSEEKVLSIEQQKKQNRVRMNLDSLTGEEVDNVGSGLEKRTRFSLSQDQESVGTSDNLEAISEAASNHSVASSLDLENENENDNLSDMVSANVSGRGTPNVSGRDTPSSQVEGEDREQRPLDLPVTARKQNQADIEEKFGKFEIKPIISGDETKSMVSDTWSTDVLASDSETVEQSDMSSQLTLESQPPGMLDTSETASQSDAWSTDVLTSDTERLQELDMDETASVARSDDTARSEVEMDIAMSSALDLSRSSHRDVGEEVDSSVEGIRMAGSFPLRRMSDHDLPASRHRGTLPQLHVSLPSIDRLPDIPIFADFDFEGHSQHASDENSMEESSVRMLDPLSVDVDGHVLSNALLNQEELTPTGNVHTSYSPLSNVVGLDGDTGVAGCPEETLASMQSLGRLSFAIKELPSKEEQEGSSALLESLQGSAAAGSPGSSRRHRSSIADLLSLDLTKTLNFSSGGRNAGEDRQPSPWQSGLVELEREMFSFDQNYSSAAVKTRDALLDREPEDARPKEKMSGTKRKATDRQAGDEGSVRLSTASGSSSSSSSSSTDVCTRNATSSRLSGISLNDACAARDGDATFQRPNVPESPPSSGAIPKSISFDKTAERRYRDVAEDEDQSSSDKHRKGFFKLSNFRFTFKGRNRKSRPGERLGGIQSDVDPGGGDVSFRDGTKDKRNFLLQRTCSEEVHPTYLETGDEILAKYRKKPSCSIVEGMAAQEMGSADPSGIGRDAGTTDDDACTVDLSNLEHCFAFSDAKRKLRMVLGSADVQTLPWSAQSCSRTYSGGARDIELVAFLRVLLAEAINLQQRPLVAHLHEALRCVEMFDDGGCQKLFRSLKDDYRCRAPYIAYLVRCRQGLLSTLAHLESLRERIERDKVVCSKYLVAMCVRMFMEKRERSVQMFVRKFQALTVADEKAQLVEKFLQYLFSAMDTDPMWQTASDTQMDHARKVIERTVMSQIYIHALYPNGDGDVLRDQVLHQHMQKLSRVIIPNHKDLRIPKFYHHECPWPSAQAEIININAFKTPRDKIRCVSCCCNTVMNLLSMAGEKTVPAADDLMPVLVYVLIKANPPSLLSTVQYINTFYEKQLEGEEAYWWTQFCSAIEFIKTMDY